MNKIFYFACLFLFGFNCEASQIEKKKLPSCDGTSNCISSQSTSKKHYIQPFRVAGDPARAWEQFRKFIQGYDRMLITHETETSLHAEATSLVLHFIDDIDAFLDAQASVIHIRSASRVGHSDFGVNRKRVEEIREHLKKLGVILL